MPWRSWKTHSASQRSPALESLTVYSITLWRECAGKHLIYSLAYVSVHTVSNCIFWLCQFFRSCWFNAIRYCAALWHLHAVLNLLQEWTLRLPLSQPCRFTLNGNSMPSKRWGPSDCWSAPSDGKTILISSWAGPLCPPAPSAEHHQSFHSSLYYNMFLQFTL